MRKYIKYGLRILLWLLLSTLVLLVLVSGIIQLNPVKQKIANVAGDKVSELINGEISIEEIQGNFFSDLSLKNISLKQEGDTVLFLSSIDARYNLFPLLGKRVEVYYIGLEKPGVWLKQLNDSTWNFSKILIPAEEQSEKNEGGSIKLDLDTVKIIEGGIEITSPDTLIPKEIKDINFAASLQLEEENLSLILSRFSFLTSEPDFRVENISFIINKNEDYIQLSDLYIKTLENRVDGRGNYDGNEPFTTEANLTTNPLKTDEFEFFLGNLKIPATPVFRFDADLNSDSLKLFLELIENDQEVVVNATSSNFRSFIDKNNQELLQYQVNTTLKKVDLSTWVGDSSLNYIITGMINVNGAGIDPESARIKLKGGFNDCLIQDRSVDSLIILANLDTGDLSGLLKGSGNFGEFSLNTELLNIFEKPQYMLKLTTRNIDVATLTGIDTLNSNLNLSLEARGQGFDPEMISASAKLDVSASYLGEIKLDNLSGSFLYEKENLVVEKMSAELKDFKFIASGNYNPGGNSDLVLKAEFNNLSSIDYYIPVSEINSEGTIEARIYGKNDSLNLDTEISLSDFTLNGNTLESAMLTGNASATPADTVANFKLTVDNLNSGNYTIKSIQADVKASPKLIRLDAEISAEDLNTDVIANLVPGGKTTSVAIDRWNINYKGEEWSLYQTPAKIEFDSVTYRIDNFYLATAETDTSQFIKIDGEISRTGQENLNLELANISVEKILELTEKEMNADGLIFLDVKLSGSAESPLMKGSFRIEDASFNDNQFSKLSAEFNYENEIVNTDASIIHSDSGHVKVKAEIPFFASLDSMKFEPLKDEELSGKLEIRKFPIAVLQTLDQIEVLTGYLDGEADIGGTLNSLNPTGNINLLDASLKIPQYGIYYKEMALNLSLAKNSATLDSILVRSEDGNLTGYGKMIFSSEIYKGDLSNTQVNLEFDNFNPVDHPQFNMQLAGNLGLEGERKNLVFNGDISIPEAEVYIPAVMNMMGQSTVPELPEPILLREMEKDSIATDTLRYVIADTIRTDTTKSFYFEKIEGSVKVNIPRNVWIKNKDMYVEIMGDIELIKNPDFFEVFGSLDVVRGQYTLLGKTFVIDKGIISFQGGEELVPNLDIEANYTFRNSERVEQTLTVFVTGDTEQPAVNFRLDGNNISEGDALSYIMFGKSMNELGMEQQDNVAEKAAANLISSQLTGYLSEKLNVDYIEVKADEGFDNATVVVGKYITNDLFVSYEQRLGETDEENISNYEVRLEYELFRFLFIELNNSSRESGFDLIFKKDFK